MSSDARLRRKNVKRMCLKHGTCLGCSQDVQWWVCDGVVWWVQPRKAFIWGGYGDFCAAVRRSDIPDFTPAYL